MTRTQARRLEQLDLNCNRPENGLKVGYRLVEPAQRQSEASYVFETRKPKASVNTRLRALLVKGSR